MYISLLCKKAHIRETYVISWFNSSLISSWQIYILLYDVKKMISLGTQTDLNFELILNFISNDLPRLVSYDLVPMLLKVSTGYVY